MIACHLIYNAVLEKLTMTVTPLTERLGEKKHREVHKWASHLSARFPKRVDGDFLRGLSILWGIGGPSFLQERAIAHVKRLLWLQYALCKRSEQEDKAIHAKVFCLGFRLCIAVGYRLRETSLSDEALVEVVGQKVAALKKVVGSVYKWEGRACGFFYIEFEKMRGRQLSFPELQEFERHLAQRLGTYLAAPTVFWPYNHEDALKQLLVLAKEVVSPQEVPQVSLHFQKQTARDVEFLVYMARVKETLSSKEGIAKECFPPSIQLVVHLKEEVDFGVPTLIEAFSMVIPHRYVKKGAVTNLLYAREYSVKLLEEEIGLFRDYNGGFFETQKKRFMEIAQQLEQKIPDFLLFGKEVFYALRPIEMQVCLEEALFEEVFWGFTRIVDKSGAFVEKTSPHVLFLRDQNPLKMERLIDRAKHFQQEGEVTAYGELSLPNGLCLYVIKEDGSDFPNLLEEAEEEVKKGGEQSCLRINFQLELVPSFDGHFLGKELRGRSLGRLLFEGLMRLGLDGQLQCSGCQEVQISKNKKRYLFTLREQFWSNGQKVTAFHYEKKWKKNFMKAIEDDFNLFYGLKNAAAIKEGTKPVSALGVRAENADKLTVNLEQADPHFLEKLTHPLFFPCAGLESEPVAFNGPYSISNKQDYSLTLEKNLYYFDRDRVFFKQMELYFEQPPQGSLQSGAPFTFMHLNDSFKTLTIKGLIRPYLMYLNTRVRALSSPLIRRALGAVIDRKWIIETIYQGHVPLHTPLPKEFSYCGHALVENDLSQGKDLFERGLKEVGLKFRDFPTLVLSCSCVARHKKLAEYLKQQWESVLGIAICLDVQTWNTFYQRLEDQSFHIAGLFKGSLLTRDVFPFLEAFSSKKTNHSAWENIEYIKCIQQAKQARSEKEKSRYFEKSEKLLLEHMPVIPLFANTEIRMHMPDLKDYVVDREGVVDLSFAAYQ